MCVHQFCLLLLAVLFSGNAFAQRPSSADSLPQGAWARMEINNGDTIFNMSLRPIRIVGPRKFKDLDEQRKLRLYARAARKVYPFAVQAINLYREIGQETQDMNRRQRRRFVKNEHQEVKEDFKEQLKNLSKTEGRVLIKMIEKELNRPFYDVIKDTRGSFTAAYWYNMGKIWDYNLKQGYKPGDDVLLDETFLDYDFGHPTYY